MLETQTFGYATQVRMNCWPACSSVSICWSLLSTSPDSTFLQPEQEEVPQEMYRCNWARCKADRLSNVPCHLCVCV